jgi:AraC family transcriptional regulator
MLCASPSFRCGLPPGLTKRSHLCESAGVIPRVHATSSYGHQHPPARHRSTEQGASESRQTLMNSSVGVIEDLRRAGVPREKGVEGYSAEFQVCLPYRGLFVWHVGKDDVVGDANQVVFCRPGEAFRMSAPIREGYSELIITPDVHVLAEIMQVRDHGMAEHPAFRRRSLTADSRLQSYRTRFLHWVTSTWAVDTLAAEESLLLLLRLTFQAGVPRQLPGASTARMIARTKEVLAAEFSVTVRLADVARRVGVSPAYLTDVFRRVEGQPVHRYLTHLRLSRALLDLPHTDDLTTLALDLGFSSHSHFSFAFRRAFGITPSQFRDQGRRIVLPKPA